MKRKDLTAYIREQIINELTEAGTAMVTTKSGTKPVGFVNPVELNPLKSDPNVSSITTTAGQKIKEADIDEMANIASTIKIQDAEKFALAKEIYTGGRTAAILSVLEEVGDEGITPQALAEKVGAKSSNEINLIINNLRAAGVISGKRDKIAKPEKGAKEEEPEIEAPETSEEEPETEEPVDTYYKGDEEEETPEEEPTAVDDKEIEKTVGKAYAELSPEEEDVFSKFKQAIINKAKILTDKKASKDDKTKAQAAIDNYKAKADLKKIFAKKGLNLIDFINGELKK